MESLPVGTFYLFSYGSNGLEQLSQRLGIPLEKLKERASAVKLNGWARGFFSWSSGRQGSVATI